MGLLVGNTTVIEHGGTYISFSRTRCKNYQSKRAEIGFVLPKDIAASEGYQLAQAVVNLQLGVRVDNWKRMDELCNAVLGEPLSRFTCPDDLEG